MSGELHVALREHINTLNPFLATNVSESFVVSLLYDTLADHDAQGNLVPNLAQRWELSPDGTRLTCWLNTQARWHDGQPVTAGDVVFTFNLVRRTALPGLARVAALVGQVEALGSAKVQFTLLKPGLESVRQVCSQVRIVPALHWEAVEYPLAYLNLGSPVGSGPFALLEHTPPAQTAENAGLSTEEGGLVLQNTGTHHSARPSIDKLIVQIIDDESQALEGLKEGTFDILGWDITRAMARDVQDNRESYATIQLAATPGLSVHSLLFNMRQAPYDNLALRSALALAIDTQAIVDQVLLGFADRGTAGLFPPASPWYDSSLPAVPFDAAQAMDKLTLAGFVDKDGDGLRENPDGSALQILITCPKLDALLQVAELVAAQWKAVGIKAAVSALPADQIRLMLMAAKFEVVLHDLSLGELEEAYFYFHSSRGLLAEGGQVSGYNYGGYASADYDRIGEMMLEEQSQERQLELLRTLQAILAADLPQIPLYSSHLLHLYREAGFSGWRPEPGLGLLARAAIARLTVR
jgi:peptide/nickel transport system substrate-binding protein